MPKNENIFVRLQIEKDLQTKALALNVRFEKDAPNFSIDEYGICWLPTLEEIDFIVEAFGMLSQNKSFNTKCSDEVTNKKPLPHPTPKTEEPVHSPYEKIAVTASTTTESTTESAYEYHPKQSNNMEKIFVQADEHTIDEALKRRKVEEEDYVANPNDRSVLDKVLKQKKKKE